LEGTLDREQESGLTEQTIEVIRNSPECKYETNRLNNEFDVIILSNETTSKQFELSHLSLIQLLELPRHIIGMT
jgi:hypothetical protein